ncbi:nuclear transport factor 2 family protein [uncultured Draconibacterium sp.]|uniref:nuclear transport factor 2 family protein n=1 Tax=uncultured Draconibacterium sp. TaxID=1573823 RepID=UPI002AA897AB|nr:nuclear transport factor 2 family protein [uncultured Draconibacterium sp.]
MKSILLVLTACTLVFYSCTNATEQALTENEKETLAQEVETTINKMMDGMKNIDVEAAFESNFLMDENFRYVDIYGKTLKKDAFRKAAHGVFDNVEKIEFEFTTPIIRIIDRKVAVVNLTYSGKYYFPGSTLAWSPCGSTLVLQKIDNEWKVIHFHESIQESEFVTTDL